MNSDRWGMGTEMTEEEGVRRGALWEMRKVEQVGSPQSRTLLPPLGWPCPSFLWWTRSFLSETTDCPPISRCRCPGSSASRCHGDHEDGAGRRTGGSRGFLARRHTAVRPSWPEPSAWTSWTPSRWRGAASPMAPPRMEVFRRSWYLIGWRRSWRCCFGHPRRRRCCSCTWRLKTREEVFLDDDPDLHVCAQANMHCNTQSSINSIRIERLLYNILLLVRHKVL